MVTGKLPPAGEVPKKLQAVIFRCLERQPDRRFSSVAELRQAVQKNVTEKTFRFERLLRPSLFILTTAAVILLRSGNTNVPSVQSTPAPSFQPAPVQPAPIQKVEKKPSVAVLIEGDVGHSLAVAL